MMDPDEALRIIRVYTARYLDSLEEPEAEEVQRYAEAVDALDGWLTKGGFLPAAWRESR